MNEQKTDHISRTLRFGEIEIYENGKDNEISTISFQIPFRASFCGRRTADEYRKLAHEEMRIKASVLFKIIKYFGAELSSGGYDGVTFADFILVCGQIGEALMETQDIIEMSFDKKAEANDEQN